MVPQEGEGRYEVLGRSLSFHPRVMVGHRGRADTGRCIASDCKEFKLGQDFENNEYASLLLELCVACNAPFML